MVGKSGEVSSGEINGGDYVINMDLSKTHFANPGITSDRANGGQVPWRTLPHETYHAVEAAGQPSTGGFRAVDPLGIGTKRPGDGPSERHPTSPIPNHESRAVRAGNLVGSQIGSKALSTNYTLPSAGVRDQIPKAVACSSMCISLQKRAL